MIKRFKGMFIGVIVTLLVLSSFVYASPIEKTINIFFKNIKLYVDGSLVTPKDATGNKVEPFIYNGTTYLPARAVAEALGKTVKWDGKTNSIYIGKVDENTPSVYLDELDHFNHWENDSYRNIGWEKWKSGDKDVTGTSYSRGIRYKMGYNYFAKDEVEQYTQYLLNGKYSKFEGTLVRHYDYKGVYHPIVLEVWGDDELLYKSTTMKASTLPIDFKVDVTGVIKLSIVFNVDDYDDDSADRCHYGIVNAGFYE